MNRSGFWSHCALQATLRAAISVLAMCGACIPTHAQTTERRLPSSQAEIQQSYAPIVRSAAPAVVNVYSQRIVRQAWRSPFADDPVFRRFFGEAAPQERVQNALGSGVIVRADGVIVTNNHVVDGADQLRVVLADRREFEAKLILADARTDLAVLRINPGVEQLPTLRFSDTSKAEVGDLVLAIGNPFGLGQTVTSGIVSALARTDTGISDFSFFIQTDAAINPGNSGGALVDMAGALMGVNTAIYSRSGGSNGVGFAIPAEMVRRVVESAINEGRVVRPWLGVKGQAVTADIARTLGLARPVGVLVSDLFPGGPGERAGVRRGDVVTKVDSQEVFDEQGLRYLAATRRPGETVSVEVLRQGRALTLSARAVAPPETPRRDLRQIRTNGPLDGAVVINLSPAVAEELGLDPFSDGVLVVESRGPAARFQLEPGDLLREINGQKVETTQRLEQLLAGASGATRIVIERRGRRLEGVARF
jgi:Do/DeqQ family serine protease